MKKLISFVIVLSILICTCSISVFAAIDYTNTYYMYGDEIKGSVVMVDTLASATTHSENLGYGKAAELKYYYFINHKLYNIRCGNEDSFVVNGFDAFSVNYFYKTETSNYFGAIGRHKVKSTSYMTWSSHACEDDSYVGSIFPDYSDV